MITISFSSASSMQLKKSPKFRQLFQESFKMSKWNGRYSPGFPHCYSTFLKGRRDPDLKRRVKLNYIIPHICHPSFHSFNSVALITFNRLSLVCRIGHQKKTFLNISFSPGFYIILLPLSQLSSVSHFHSWDPLIGHQFHNPQTSNYLPNRQCL